MGGGGLMLLLRAVQHLAWTYARGLSWPRSSGPGAAERIAVLFGAGLIVGLSAG